MFRTRVVVYVLLALLMAVTAFGADITGKWTASFDTQIGTQDYTYDFKAAGGTLTGRAKSNIGEGDISEGKINGDQVSFVEMLKFEDQLIRIEYTGKVAGDEIRFTRKVGEFATEELVAKRVK